MRKLFLPFVASIFLLVHSSKALAQNVGIGTTAPNASALLHVNLGASTNKGLLITGTYNSSSTVPDLGSGSRLMFYPGKAAFRAGFVDAGSSSTYWDNVNVGIFSSATGYNTLASGYASTAMGSVNTASGYASTAMGEGSSASNNYCVAMGYHASASGAAAIAMGNSTTASALSSTAMGGFTVANSNYSTAMGFHTTASSYQATAIGYYTTASGETSFAMGDQSVASGYSSVAMGLSAVASGDGSFALGNAVNTNDKYGAFIFGDSDPLGEGATISGYTNEFVARFYNGYYFMTSGNVNRFGVSIGHNGNAWVSICNKNMKENFQPLNGEEVLRKLSKINFTSWNYKQQDPVIYRHYGIMAQDFYEAFGHDDYGTIGNDTTVNPIDMIGIDMTAIQALEKRTTDLKNENKNLREENKQLKEMMIGLQSQFAQQQKRIDEITLLKQSKPVKKCK